MFLPELDFHALVHAWMVIFSQYLLNTYHIAGAGWEARGKNMNDNIKSDMKDFGLGNRQMNR